MILQLRNFMTFLSNFWISVTLNAIAASASKSVFVALNVLLTFVEDLISESDIFVTSVSWNLTIIHIFASGTPSAGKSEKKDFIQQKIMFRQVE